MSINAKMIQDLEDKGYHYREKRSKRDRTPSEPIERSQSDGINPVVIFFMMFIIAILLLVNIGFSIYRYSIQYDPGPQVFIDIEVDKNYIIIDSPSLETTVKVTNYEKKSYDCIISISYAPEGGVQFGKNHEFTLEKKETQFFSREFKGGYFRSDIVLTITAALKIDDEEIQRVVYEVEL